MLPFLSWSLLVCSLVPLSSHPLDGVRIILRSALARHARGRRPGDLGEITAGETTKDGPHEVHPYRQTHPSPAFSLPQ